MKPYLAMVVTNNFRVIAKKECKSVEEAVQLAYAMSEAGSYDLVVYRQKDDRQIVKYGFTSIWGIT